MKAVALYIPSFMLRQCPKGLCLFYCAKAEGEIRVLSVNERVTNSQINLFVCVFNESAALHVRLR